jgi:hypothetical protein
MPKIKIEIDISSEEIVEIFKRMTTKKSGLRNTAYSRYFEKTDKDPYQAAMNKSPSKKVRKSPIKDKKKGPVKGKKNLKGKHARKGGWTQLEVAWLKEWISTKPVNQVTVKAFRKEFGYVRSFSSLSGKAFSLRKK